MTHITRRGFALATLAGLACGGATQAAAQASYPSRPVTMIVPFPAGSSPDIVARFVGQKLQDRTGQSFVIDNRAGAGGAIGAEVVARAPADGYTLFFMVNSIVTTNQFIYKTLRYDPVKDFAPVSLVAAVPYVLLAHKDFAAKSLRDLIAMAKAKPGSIDYASHGIGGAGHVIIELMNSLAGIRMTHIPFSTGAMNAVLGNQVPLILQPTTTALTQIKSGTLIGLGSTGTQRLPALPDMPTIGEIVPGFEADGWQGLMAPAGTPSAAIDRINREMAAILAQPDTVERFTALGIQAWPSTPQKMQEVITADIQKWGKVIRDAGVVPQ